MAGSQRISPRELCEEEKDVSQRLLKDLSAASKEVNQAINELFDNRLEPAKLYDASKHLIEAGGKRLRPFLVLKACEMVGGNREDALPVAAAVELLHTFTLVHDDIMDSDDKRRGKPTVHTLWGIPIAISAGDMLYAKAYEAVLSSLRSSKVSPRRILKILSLITEATISICEGQALDILFERRELISEKEYFNMITKKTAGLLETSTRVGAIVGGGKAAQVKRLGRYAYYSGLAFQVIDDYLGITADEKVLGKPVGSDIREGKRTLILIHALTNATKTKRNQMYSVLGRGDATPTEIEEVSRIIHSLGSLDYAFKKAEQLVAKAKRQLSPFPPSQTKETLLNLADYVVSRKY
jgi:geranylgeranyl diphosphate synthase type I